MSNKYIIILLLSSVAVLYACNGAKDKTPAVVTHEVPEVRKTLLFTFWNKDYVKKYLPGWIMAPASCWDDSVYEKYTTDTSRINFVSGDFNCDGQEDAAIIVKDSSDNFSIAIFESYEKNYIHGEMERLGNYKSKKLDVGLKAVTPGLLYHHNDLRPDTLPCGAVEKFYLNKDGRKLYSKDKTGRPYIFEFADGGR